MSLGVIYIKTDLGRAAVAERTGGLTAVQRRLLIVIDGQKSVNDLGAVVRTEELEHTLRFLCDQGLIAPTGDIALLHACSAPGFAAASVNTAPRAATNPPSFVALRQEASDFVATLLGQSGEPICEAIDRCQNPVELRKLLRGVEIFMGDRLSAETTQAFVRHFGALLL